MNTLTAKIPARPAHDSADTVEAHVDALSRVEYYRCISCFTDCNLYQSWDFAAVAAEDVGGRISTIALRRGDQWIGAAGLRIKTMPVTGWGVAYGLYAPLWQRPGATVADFATILSAIRDEYGHRRGLSVRLRPKIVREDPRACEIQAAFAATGFRLAAEARSEATFWLDLTPPLDEIRSRIQRRWRNYLSRAEKAGFELRTDGEDRSFELFLGLYQDLKQRKEFKGIDPRALRRINALLPPHSKMEITLAYNDGRAVSGHIASHMGDTCLGLLAATAADALDLHAANLVWWERIQRAKAGGLKWYDLGGYDYETNASVAESKRKLGGQPVTYLGEYRFEPSPIRAALVSVAEKGYRALHRRKDSD